VVRLRGAVLEDQDNARRIDHTGAGWHRRSFDIHAATLLVEHACSRRSQPLAIMPGAVVLRASQRPLSSLFAYQGANGSLISKGRRKGPLIGCFAGSATILTTHSLDRF
jgi:hypothetical protein